MSTDQPPPGSGEPPPRDPFGSGPENPPPGRGGPHDTPPGGGFGTPPNDPYGQPAADPLAGMPPLANRGKRLLARIIDALLVGVPLTVIVYFAAGSYRYDSSLRSFWQDLVYALVYFAYDGYMLTTRGQTFGKKWLHIRVALLDSGANPAGAAGWTRAAVYSLPPVVPCCGAVFWLVNAAWCLWDKPYHQCLHDKAAHTVVVEVPRQAGP
jgi:uncharacterized RDD family membrane protein YckC